MDTRNLFTKQPSKKVEDRHTGKYRVKMIISNHDVKLDLPSDLHIYPVFYIKLFDAAAIDNFHSGHLQPPGRPIKVDKEVEY